jgi:hypothetical protein
VTFPLPFTVGLHSYVPGGDDGYGNPLPTFSPPKDEPGTSYSVLVGYQTSQSQNSPETSIGLSRICNYLRRPISRPILTT